MNDMKLTIKTTAVRTDCFDFTTLPAQFSEHFYYYIKELINGDKKSGASIAAECKMFFTHTAPYFDSLGLNSFADINAERLNLFIAYLSTVSSTRDGEPLKLSSKRLIFSFLKTYLTWLAHRFPDEVPQLSLFKPNPFSRGVNDKLKTKLLPDEVVENFKRALRNEMNPYKKVYIALAVYLGLRQEDILELRYDCLINDMDKEGAYFFRYYNNKSSQWYKKPLPKSAVSVVIALKLLIEHSEIMRAQSGDKRIFIWSTNGGTIRRYTPQTVVRWLDDFIKKNKIYEKDGSPLKVTTHQFRHFLLSSMDAESIDLEHAQYVADHEHSSTTRKYYIHSKDKTYNEQMDALDKLVDSITITDNTDIINDTEFQNNKQSLRLSDGYCRDTRMATEEEYICEHYQKRGNCYGCPKMITTPDFLPHFYKELEALEVELEEKSQYGENILRQIHFRIEMIKLIIERLEELIKGDVA